jgi:hypothetical protein
MAIDTRLEDLARRIDAIPDDLTGVKSIYQAFHTLASTDGRTPARVDELITAIMSGLDELDERIAGEGSIQG